MDWIVAVLTVILSFLTTFGTMVFALGRYRERLTNQDREIRDLKQSVTELKKLDAVVTKVQTDLDHFNTSLDKLEASNQSEFNRIANLITGLGEKLADHYVRKEDMHLYQNNNNKQGGK